MSTPPRYKIMRTLYQFTQQRSLKTECLSKLYDCDQWAIKLHVVAKADPIGTYFDVSENACTPILIATGYDACVLLFFYISRGIYMTLLIANVMLFN